MPEHVHDQELLDLGAASALTLGEPEERATENVTTKDFYD